MSIVLNSVVEQVMPNPIKGTVIGFSQDQYDGSVLVIIEWADEVGQVHRKSFKQSEIKEVQ